MMLARVLLAAAVASADVEGAADRSPAPKAPSAPSVFVRVGAGLGRGSLFLGSDGAREATRVPLSAEVGLARDRFGGSMLLVVEPGRSEHGVAMTRVALGATPELRLGPLFAGAGAHFVWFGAHRKSRGPADGYQEAEATLWRLGMGLHGMVGLDLHVLAHAGAYFAVRGDVDALVSVGVSTVPYGGVSGVVGLSFY